eukprot:CAMPEP_0179186622 /NCGR_PEP_ID=MMETSP0796-20121207/92570_1 /TAXON_ID=73915 /ORGANISM="Pyrodinium bahamense, Strain pbaha01" /LENGTH=166 /DNA_ID=CAMNT_0020890629 /DNA_START=801 /DNA_END=1299 /DNA_ORIENTATION=-
MAGDHFSNRSIVVVAVPDVPPVDVELQAAQPQSIAQHTSYGTHSISPIRPLPASGGMTRSSHNTGVLAVGAVRILAISNACVLADALGFLSQLHDRLRPIPGSRNGWHSLPHARAAQGSHYKKRGHKQHHASGSHPTGTCQTPTPSAKVSVNNHGGPAGRYTLRTN